LGSWLKIENTRTMAFTDDELNLVLEVLQNGRPATAMRPAVRPAPHLIAPIVFASWTGWRIPSDVLTLKWSQVDLDAGEVTRWSRGTSKAHESIVFPVNAIPELEAVLAEQREHTRRWRRPQAASSRSCSTTTAASPSETRTGRGTRPVGLPRCRTASRTTCGAWRPGGCARWA